MNSAIFIKDLKKKYNNFCLNIKELKIPSGVVVGLIGENGAGKTTLIKLLLNKMIIISTKKYQNYIGRGKTDFVMMFIPNEGAYIAAMQLDNTLWQEAYDRRVLLVSPTHLFSALRLIAQLWSHDKQTRNAVEIAKAAGAMVDKFVNFTKDMSNIEKSLTKTREAYDEAMKKLCTGQGNLVSRAEKLRELGAKAEKQLPSEIASRNLDQ